MPRQSPRATGIAGLLLAGAWSCLAYGFGALVSLPPGDTDPVSAASVERRTWAAAVDVTGIDPCTEEIVAVEAQLTVDTVRAVGHAGAGTEVYLSLEPRPKGARSAGIEPLTRHFARYATPVGGVPYAHTLRTPVVGGHRGLDLVVDVRGAVDDRGEVSLSLSERRLDARRSPCGGVEPGPPSQPITLGPRAPAPV